MSRRGFSDTPSGLTKVKENSMDDAVRIFPFPFFQSSNDLDIEKAISAEAVGDSFFVIPTVNDKIDLYGIEEAVEGGGTKSPLISSFDVVSTSRSVHYLYQTGWLLSLERHPTYKAIARIYFNWRSEGDKLSCYEDTNNDGEVVGLHIDKIENKDARRDIFHENTNGIQYIEFPMGRNIRRVSVCPATNLFALANRNMISVWKYNTTGIFLQYKVKVDFDIEKIDLYEEYLAYSSFAEVRVIRTHLIEESEDSSLREENIFEEKEFQESSYDPFTPIEDDNMGVCTFNAVSGASLNTERTLFIPNMTNSMGNSPTSKRIAKQSAIESTFEVLGAADNMHCVIANKYYSCHVAFCVMILHRKFATASWLHSVHLLPEYRLIPEHFNDASTPEEEERILNRNRKKQRLLEEGKETGAHRVRCMIATSRKGFLYDVTDPRLLCEYSFTEHTFGIKLTSSMMYTLTRSGMIIWSIRCCSSAGEQFPAPCVMGMEVLPRTRYLVVVGDYFLAIPPLSEEGSTTITAKPRILRSSPLLTVFEEIREFALLNQQSSYEAFFQLMLELHFLVEAKLQTLNKQLLNTNYYQRSPHCNTTERDKEKQILYQLQAETSLYYEKRRESSAALGDYQFRSKLYSRAAMFYAESDRLMSRVIEPMLSAIREETKSSARRGMLNYLNTILFDPEKIPIVDETPELSDKIIAIYYTLAKSKVASVILESCLTQYNQETALLLLEEKEKTTVGKTKRGQKKPFYHASFSSNDNNNHNHGTSTPSLVLTDLTPSFSSAGLSLKNIFVRALLYLDLGQQEKARADLFTLEPEVIIEFCVQHPQLFLPDIHTSDGKPQNTNCRRVLLISAVQREDSSFVTLGKLLYSAEPWVLLEILIQLKEHIPTDDALVLLHFYEVEKLKEDYLFLLENYLEWMLLSGCATADTFEALTLIYVEQLIQNKNVYPTSVESQRGTIRRKWLKKHRCTFIHQRAEWLNQIAPFDTINHFASSSPFSTVDEEAAPVFYLQKLQGLLSDESSRAVGSINPLLDKILGTEVCEGKLSLELLCLPLHGQLMTAIERISIHSPHITCAYAATYCSCIEEWKQVLYFLAEAGDALYHIYTEIISHLVVVQDPASFVTILPDNGNMNFFLPFIEQCFRFHYATLLKQDIANQAKTKI